MNTYIEIAKRAREYGETNCCTVIMTALALETTFEDAWNLMHQKGRKIGKGLTYSQYVEALNERGITLVNVYERYRTRCTGSYR